MQLKIYRGASVNETITIDEKAVLSQKFYGENQISVQTESREPLSLAIGDKIFWGGNWYYLNSLPDVVKNSTLSFEYNMVFESEYYNLSKVQFMYFGASEFDLITDLPGFIDLLITNLNRIYGTGIWTRGTCDQTDITYKNLHFSQQNCREVVQTLCSEFSGELWFNQKQICFTDELGADSGLTFQYRAGLRNIQRQTVSDKNIVTRLYAFGSDKNLGTTYRSGKKRLEFDDYPNTEMEHRNYLSKNTATYGIIEHTEFFEDIYPHRTGTVSAVNSINVLKFTDSSMPSVFLDNLAPYLISGVTAKIHFNTGDLAGYEFEISDYDSTTKEFTAIAVKPSENEDEIPNSVMKPAIGDTYVLVDIMMPQTYVTTAEAELKTKAQAYLDANSSPHLKYSLTLDPRNMRSRAINLRIGDKITITDTDLNMTALLRITELSYPLNDQYAYVISISDYIDTPFALKNYDTLKVTSDKVAAGKVANISDLRQSWRTVEELRNMTFDPEGYYFSESIKPLSIETSMLSVGSKSTNFALSGIEIKANLAGNKANCDITAGSLIHFSINETVTTWTLYASSYTGLTDSQAYYIYAKCHKTNLTAFANQIVLDANTRIVDFDPDYYYFLIGVLHSVVNTVRAVSLTYGHTMINGRHITTGRISSANSGTYFDLDNNTLVIGSASGYNNFSDKPSLGALASLSAVEAAQLGTTVIVDGYIKTSLLTADNIQAGTFTGLTFKTDTGAAGHYKRVEISGANNNLVFYNSSNAAMVQIDTGTYGSVIVGNSAGNEQSWVSDGAMSLWSGTNGKIVLYGNYYDGLAWLTNTFSITANGVGAFKRLYVSPAEGFYCGTIKVLGYQQSAIANPTGGITIDSVARTAINNILTALRNHGAIAT